jgi:3-phenylpropionate/trans-cinnamate dioxygenase ferredoxin subunit
VPAKVPDVGVPTGFERVADAAPDAGEMRAVLLADGTRVCVANTSGGLCAVRDQCTHSGFSLAEGELEGTTLTCIWHGARFDARTGAVLGGPADEALETFEVLESSGALFVRRNSERRGEQSSGSLGGPDA